MKVILDLEANALLPEVTKIWCVVAQDFHTKEVFTFVQEEVYTLEFKKFLDGLELCIGHNLVGYDCRVFEKLLNYSFPSEKVRDTLVMSRLCDPMREGGHSLEAWSKRFGLHKPEIKDFSVYTPEMLERCKADVEINHKLYRYLLQKEITSESKSALLVEQDVRRIMDEQVEEGVFINRQKVQTLNVTCKKRADEIQQEVRKTFPIRSRQLDVITPRIKKDGTISKVGLKSVLSSVSGDSTSVSGQFSTFSWEEFNLDSPTQRVQRLLERGWVPTQFTPKGSPQFTEHSATNIPEAKLLAEYLLVRNRERTTKQWLDLCDSNGYLHGRVNSLGTYTHRMSHDNPNLANIPSAELDESGNPKLGLPGKFGWEMRECFTVENPDEYGLVDIDLTAIQLKAFAHYVGNKEYVALLDDVNCDIHAVHAEALGGVERSKAKTYIYAYLLGAGFKKLGTILTGVPDMQAGKSATERMWEKMPFLQEFREEIIPRWVAQGSIKGLDGRRIKIPDYHHALAIALQSFEAIVIKHTISRYYKELKRRNIQFKQRLVIHDELLIEGKKKDLDTIGSCVVETIRQVGTYLGSLPALDGKYRIGATWSQCH